MATTLKERTKVKKAVHLDPMARLFALKKQAEDLQALYEQERDLILHNLVEKGVQKVEKSYATFTVAERDVWDYKGDQDIVQLDAELAGRKLEYRKIHQPKEQTKYLVIKGK